MTTSYYRIQPAHYDTAALLDPEMQWSYSWCDQDDVRRGISVCDSVEELAAYLAQTGIEWDPTWVLVELAGRWSEDTDQDAHLGARLIIPTEVVSVRPIDDAFLDMVFSHVED
jgi:hypothetical protein